VTISTAAGRTGPDPDPDGRNARDVRALVRVAPERGLPTAGRRRP
jgi:hypothetical protein